MIRSIPALVAALALLAPSPPPAAKSTPAQASPRAFVISPAPASPGASVSPRGSGSPRASASPAASPGSGAAFDLGVWTIHATSVDANFKTGTFSTPKQVVMTRVGGDVTADRSDGNYKKQLVNLYGHVVMHDTKGDYGGLGQSKPGQAPAPSTLTADKAQIDGHAKVYKAIGNVHFVQADTNVTADNGTLDDATHELDLQGNVHVVQGSRTIDAQSVTYSTLSGQAHAEGNVTMQFPGEFSRTLATPKPLHVKIPKNSIVHTAPPITPSP